MKNKSSLQIVVGSLIMALVIAACNSPTPTPIAQVGQQGPTIQIGSASMSPDKTMKVCAGETVALTTKGGGTDLTYTWNVDGNGQLKHQGGKGDTGSSNRYTAPSSTGEEVVKITVTDANKQSASDQVVIKVVACPINTPTFTPVPTLTPTPIMTPTPSPTSTPTPIPTKIPRTPTPTSGPLPCNSAKITWQRCTRGNPTVEPKEQVRRTEKISWDPSTCIMDDVQIYQEGKLIDSHKNVQSGTIDTSDIKPGWTGIKIWYSGELVDNCHIVLLP